MLKVGDKVPEIRLEGTLRGQDTTIDLGTRGRNTVLVFFPFAFTPVWTRELPDVNSKLSEFEARDAQVLGISMDSVHTNRKYAESMGGLDFPIISDWHPHGRLTREFGVLVEEAGCPSRTTVVIDRDGVIRDMHTNPIGEDRDFSQTLARLDQINQAVKR